MSSAEEVYLQDVKHCLYKIESYLSALNDVLWKLHDLEKKKIERL